MPHFGLFPLFLAPLRSAMYDSLSEMRFFRGGEGDSPIFAAIKHFYGTIIFSAAKIGTVPCERLPKNVISAENTATVPANAYRLRRRDRSC